MRQRTRAKNMKQLKTILCAGLIAAALSAAASDAPAAPAATPEQTVSFRRDVMPVFFRAGCNVGGCHGSARGKDGFRLSLFGFDPAGDYFRLTQQMVGRRIDLAVPEQSLLLLKSTGKVPHTGGELFKKESPYYSTLLRWIEAGAPDDATEIARPDSIAIVPEKIVFDGKVNPKQQLKVLAKYPDGTSHDVTNLAVFSTGNKTVADINADGLLTAGKRGDAFVFARFNKYTVAAEMIVLPTGTQYRWNGAVAANYIDERVYDKLQKLQINPSDVCSDDQFLRRAYLDLVGLPPTSEEFRSFMKSEARDKRTKLIDALLERPEFADLWAARWSEWVKVREVANSNFGAERKSAMIYYEWIREQFLKNVPLDKFVTAQIVSKGSNFDCAESNFWTMVPPDNYDPKAVAADNAQLLLGIRLQCAECHNHPFDRWTQDDYYGFVSFFTGLKRKVAAEQREVYVSNDNNAAPAKHLLDGRPVPAKFLGGDTPELKGKDPRIAYASWLVSSDNDIFARNMANRIWAQFFGRGIVEPVDDVRVSNPPSNRELLDDLAKHLVANKFDLRKLVRDICLSKTYQASPTVNATNHDDHDQFSHAPVRRLRADVMLDSLDRATGEVTSFSSVPKGTRAVQIFEGGRRTGGYFLKAFGLSSRETVCVCETRTEPTFAQALHLLNGSTVQKKIGDSKIIAEMLKKDKLPEEIIEELYVRALSRTPSSEERATMRELVGKDPKDPKAYEDIFWALFNSTEFGFNH